MSKVGRNDPCPCGSGKKYKRCCIDKPKQASKSENILRYLRSFITYEEVNEMSTTEIVKRLESIGVIFDKNAFLKDVEKFYSAEQISEEWFKKFKVTAKGREEDFPWLAAWILWERLAPPHILSMEQMSDLIDEGFEYLSENHVNTACNIWLRVWEGMKYRFKPEYKTLGFLDKQYRGSFFIKNFCQDLEIELFNAGAEDKTYFIKRINYCREFVNYFPDEDELIVHNMRRSIAESYSSLGDYEQAESEFEKLIQDYPQNSWGYVGWGDMYFYDKEQDFAKAKELYEKGLTIGEDETAIDALQERIKELEYRFDI